MYWDAKKRHCYQLPNQTKWEAIRRGTIYKYFWYAWCDVKGETNVQVHRTSVDQIYNLNVVKDKCLCKSLWRNDGTWV